MNIKNKQFAYLSLIIFIILSSISILYYYNKYIVIREGWGKVGRSISSAASRAAKAARDAARRAAEAARRAAEEAARRLREMTDGFNRLMRAISNTPSRISGTFNTLNTLKRDVSRTANKIFSEVRKIEKLMKFPNKFFNDISKGTTDFYNMIEREMNKLIKQIRDFAVTMFDKIRKEITEEFNGIFGAILNFFDRLGRMITEFFKWILKVLENIFGGIFRDIKNFFEKTFLDGLMSVFDFIMSVFKMIGGIFKRLFDFIIAIPGCVPYWMKDVAENAIDDILPDWLKWLNKNIFIPVFMFFLHIFQFILSLFGFNFDIKLNNEKCYPKFPMLEKFIKLIEDLFFMIVNLFTGKKKSKKSKPTPSKPDNLKKKVTNGSLLDTARNAVSSATNIKIPGIEIPTF